VAEAVLSDYDYAGRAPGGATVTQRWLARLALVAAAAAVLVAPHLGRVWWALAHRGPVRWLAAALAVPVGVDSEALLLDTPLQCTVKPAVLRVACPVTVPGWGSPGLSDRVLGIVAGVAEQAHADRLRLAKRARLSRSR
jgi:hypothetical protein